MTAWLLYALVALLGVDRWLLRAELRRLRAEVRTHTRECLALRAERDVAQTLAHLWEMRAHNTRERQRDAS